MKRLAYLLAICIFFSLILSVVPADANPKNGVWYKKGEPGSGIYIDIQGEHLAIGWFAYDQATGAPVWYMSDGGMSGPNSYSGKMWKFTNGQYIGGPYVPPTQSTIGTISIIFHSDTSATVTSPMATVAVERYFNFKPPSESVLGTYSLKACTVVYDYGVTLKTDDGSLIASGKMVVSPFTITQSITVNGVGVSMSGSYSYQYFINDHTGLLRFASNGASNSAFFWLSGYYLTTMTHADIYGGFTEWDMWTKVSDKTTMTREDIVEENDPGLVAGSLAGVVANK